MKPTGPQISVALIMVALVSYVFVGAHRFAARAGDDVAAEVAPTVTTDASGKPVPVVFPAPGKDFIGVTTKEGAYDFTPVDAFQRTTGHQPSVMMFSEGWVVGRFDRAPFDKIAKRGMLPMVSWEPWNYKDDNVDKNGAHADQPAFRLSRIIAGDYDAYLEAYAKGVKNLQYEVAIRLAHEMNGFWYPWGVGVNGNKTGDYVKMWKHVRDIFDAAGVHNVTWVWSANVQLGTKTKLSSLYPGDDLVDWVGLSGYYGTAGTTGYRTPGDIFNNTLKELRTFAHRPIVITETAATNVAGLRTRWVGDLFRYLPQHREIIGFIWYEAVKETDWRLASTPAAAKEFGRLAAAAPYQVPWAGNMAPNIAAPTWGAGTRPATSPPTGAATTSAPTGQPPRTSPTTARPTTKAPTARPTTKAPTTKPTTKPPTTRPTTKPPTKQPTPPPTTPPTTAPTTEPEAP